MNALLESKQLLEAKIALSKSLIAKKKKDFDYHTEQANEFQLIIEGLVTEQWKDQAALNAINEQLNPIEEEEAPTLALQKSNPLWKELTACLAFLLLTSLCYSQAFVSGEAGNRMGINAGAIVHHMEFKGGSLFPYSRSTVVSNITYAEAGYQIGNNFEVTPLIGIAHYHDTVKGIQAINKTVLATSIELGKDFTTAANHYGNYYLFITQAHSFFAGAGFKIYIK
jgi:hypothetical protein